MDYELVYGANNLDEITNTIKLWAKNGWRVISFNTVYVGVETMNLRQAFSKTKGINPGLNFYILFGRETGV